MPVVEITNLSKYYGRSRGIEEISFEVSKGDIFGFIGPNGAGKSTTIRILLNLIFPSSGSGRIFDMDLVKDSKKIRSRIGYIPSDANLYDRMKVHEFLEYIAGFHAVQFSKHRIRELCDVFDLDPSRKIPELSMGNKKKVAIVQALVHQPALLILDEPTTGLDPLVQSRFFDLLREVNKNGTTIFFSSHNLGEIQAFCKTVAIIREGKIINVEEIATLRKKQLKRVRISFAEEMKIPDLTLEGIKMIKKESDKDMEFLFSGNTNELVQWLSAYQLENLSIEEPSLDEIFLHYYKKGGES
jgi:ABC-2 type transport system ATP-binding protein